MKILLTRRGQKISVFHDPKEIISNPKTRTVKISEIGTNTILEEHHIISKNLSWLRCGDLEEEEVLVEFEVE